jgi:hypothetical protein
MRPFRDHTLEADLVRFDETPSIDEHLVATTTCTQRRPVRYTPGTKTNVKMDRLANDLTGREPLVAKSHIRKSSWTHVV